jgi:uncharacterized protein
MRCLANVMTSDYMGKAMEIEWDQGNREKCQKHGVSIAEIEELLFSNRLVVFPDPAEHEERKRGVGRTVAGRNVFLVWTIRETASGSKLRPISARYMHAKEVKNYEQ